MLQRLQVTPNKVEIPNQTDHRISKSMVVSGSLQMILHEPRCVWALKIPFGYVKTNEGLTHSLTVWLLSCFV